MFDAGGDYTRLELGRTAFHEWQYDSVGASFVNAGGRTPDWIVLYDSPLRDHAAPLRDLDEVRTMLSASKEWQRAHAQLDELQRQTKLEADAQEVAELPRWYLRKDLRSFDHIHPTEQGHRLIAEIMCPSLPESWGCTCPEPEAAAADDTPVEAAASAETETP